MRKSAQFRADCQFVRQKTTLYNELDKIRDWLYIGDYHDARDEETIRHHGIKAILNLVEQTRYEGIALRYLPVEDGRPLTPSQISQGKSFIKVQRLFGYPTLVSCGEGISRSTTFCMAILMDVEDLTIFEAYDEVKKHHPQAEPHAALVVSLATYHRIKLTEEDWVRYMNDAD